MQPAKTGARETGRTMGKWRALAVILVVAGVVADVWAGTSARAETVHRVSLGDVGAGVQEQSYLALRCLELAPGRERMADLATGSERREVATAEDSDGLPAPIYGFAFASEDEDEPACAMRQARRAHPGA